jgi:hypothetical protein
MARRIDWEKLNRERRFKRTPASYSRRRFRARPQRTYSSNERLLRVTRADGFDAKAIWRWQMVNQIGQWICAAADPGLQWMRGLTPAAAQQELVNRRFSYRWFRPSAGLQSKADVHGLPRPNRAGRGTLNIKPHEKIRAGSGRIRPERVKLREIKASSTVAMAESAALQHGSPRGSEREKPLSGESSFASVSLRSPMPMVPTAVGLNRPES